MTLTDMPSAAAGQDGAVASGKGPRAGQPKRRAFTAEYKMPIVTEYDQLDDPGAWCAATPGRAVQLAYH